MKSNLLRRVSVAAFVLVGAVDIVGGAGCSSTRTITVPVPPRVHLSSYETIGLVTFSCNTPEGREDEDKLRQLCTQRFMQAMQEAQPGTAVLELGLEARVLASVDRKKWDAKTMQAIKDQHGVDAVIIGSFDIEEVKPEFQLSTMFKSFSVKSDVNVRLSARLMETDSGATMWTDSAAMTANLRHAEFNTKGQGHFGATDPEAVYGEMVGSLVNEVTDDFRVHYVTKRVQKEQAQQSASAE